MKTRLILIALAVWSTGSILADSVLDWNAIAANTIFAANRAAGSATLDFAVVQAAVHDAVQAYQKRFEPYAIDISGAGGSMDAAVAKATRDVLVNRFPAQAGTVDTAYNNYFTAQGLALNDPGVSVGAHAAAAIITLRTGDGSFNNAFPPIFGANAPGVWRPTTSYKPAFPPPSGLPMATPWMPDVTPFTILSGDQFRPGPPPALNSTQYRKEYDEVKALGRDTGSTRTPNQTEQALFWSDTSLRNGTVPFVPFPRITCQTAVTEHAFSHWHFSHRLTRSSVFGTPSAITCSGGR
jgi:hypothetical protein